MLRDARVCATLEEALDGSAFTVACSARVREIAAPMVSAREAAARIVRVARTQQAALVFGNETFGLDRRAGGQVPVARDHTRESATTPRSMSRRRCRCSPTSCGWRRTVRTHGASRPQPLASFEELERFYEHLERTLLETGFLNPGYNKKLMPRLRRLFGRSQLEKEEISILRGHAQDAGPAQEAHSCELLSRQLTLRSRGPILVNLSPVVSKVD